MKIVMLYLNFTMTKHWPNDSGKNQRSKEVKHSKFNWEIKDVKFYLHQNYTFSRVKVGVNTGFTSVNIGYQLASFTHFDWHDWTNDIYFSYC